LPEQLATVVALALEKRPEVRYADGSQLASDLRAVAVLVKPPGVAAAVIDGRE
jgi:serine/threonine-protein kinase